MQTDRGSSLHIPFPLVKPPIPSTPHTQSPPAPPNPNPSPPEWKRPRPQHHCWLILAACSAAYLLSTWLQKKVLLDISIFSSVKTERYFSYFCISDTFIAKENKDIRLVQQQTKHLCKCKYVHNDYASCGPQTWWPKSLTIWSKTWQWWLDWLWVHRISYFFCKISSNWKIAKIAKAALHK